MADKHKTLLVLSGLTVSILAVFWQVRSFEFINYDDDKYVSENSHISTGLKWDNIVWAFKSVHVGHWQPLTAISHMLDCELYDLNAAGHHITNLILHVVNTLLLFIVLRRMTSAFWQSAFVAALFALHPLHVESVAWITERRDVLSALFLFLTIAAYFRYVKRPGVKQYLLILLLFALGLMSKPMLVTLPFMLLLLDYWPLNRPEILSKGQIYRIVGEKIPFFILTIVSSIVTFFVQRHSGAVADIHTLTLKMRISNTVVSYIQYIYKMFWPTGLAIYYPYNVGKLSTVNVLLAATALLAASILVIRYASKYKYMPVGWFWYLGTLIPVIGLVQTGGQALADRYTYIPFTGLFIIVAWGLNDLLAGWKYRRILLGLSGIVVISVLSACVHLQVSYWRNSRSLSQHALKVTKRNYLAHNNLAVVLMKQHNFDEAISQLKAALQAKPDYVQSYNNLGIVYGRLGRADEEIQAYEQSVKIKPDNAWVLNSLGAAYSKLGRDQQAIEAYKQAIAIKPDYAQAYCNLGISLTVLCRYKESIQAFEQAIKLKPDLAEAHCVLGISYFLSGDKDAAQKQLNILKSLDPKFAAKLANLIMQQ